MLYVRTAVFSSLFSLVFIFIFSTRVFAANYPPDLLADIEWSDSSGTAVEVIENSFNAARTAENSQLTTSIPMLTMPSQVVWDAKTDTEKALWLINEERVARELLPLHSGEPNVISVAQNYANLLMDTKTFSHYEDGNPWDRLNSNPAINSCHDSLSVAENLAIFWANGTNWTLPVERSVYNWMYDDGPGWGHRHAILWYPYNNNSGAYDTEGFLGVGTAYGAHTYNNKIYPNSIIVVMNVFDPCITWDYSTFVVPGDVDGNMQVDLVDAISAFRLLTGNPPTTVHLDADINDDQLIGIAEVIFILGELSK